MLWLYGTIITFIAIKLGPVLDEVQDQLLYIQRLQEYGLNNSTRPTSVWLDAIGMKTVYNGEWFFSLLLLIGLVIAWLVISWILRKVWDSTDPDWETDEGRSDFFGIKPYPYTTGSLFYTDTTMEFELILKDPDGTLVSVTIKLTNTKVFEDLELGAVPYVNWEYFKRYSSPLAHHLFSDSDGPRYYDVHLPKGSSPFLEATTVQ